MKKIIEQNATNSPLFVINPSLDDKIHHAKLSETLQKKRESLTAAYQRTKTKN
jgi:hypothetical protein